MVNVTAVTIFGIHTDPMGNNTCTYTLHRLVAGLANQAKTSIPNDRAIELTNCCVKLYHIVLQYKLVANGLPTPWSIKLADDKLCVGELG